MATIAQTQGAGNGFGKFESKAIPYTLATAAIAKKPFTTEFKPA
jgi:hypothetical protein